MSTLVEVSLMLLGAGLGCLAAAIVFAFIEG